MIQNGQPRHTWAKIFVHITGSPTSTLPARHWNLPDTIHLLLGPATYRS